MFFSFHGDFEVDRVLIVATTKAKAIELNSNKLGIYLPLKGDYITHYKFPNIRVIKELDKKKKKSK